MQTRKLLQSELRCPCDKLLDNYELGNYDEFQGLCEECYLEAMAAAFERDNDDKIFDDDMFRIDDQD